MKKITTLLLAAVLLISASSCSKKSDEAQKNVGQVTGTQAEETAKDKYIGAFYTDGNGPNQLCMITQSGAVEKLGDVYGMASFTDDGEYVVWRDSTKVFAKSANKNAVELCSNADSFVLKKDTGMLIVFCDDGIYTTTKISDGIKKVNDMSDGSYRTSISNDGKYMAYISSEYEVHLLNLTTAEDKVIGTNADHGDSLVCVSENEVYYHTIYEADNQTYLWDGTTSAPSDVNYHDGFGFRYRHIAGLEGFGNADVLSENRSYVLIYDNNSYTRYKIGETALEEPTVIDHKYCSAKVADDGTVFLSPFGEENFTVVYQGETFEFTGKIANYNKTVPYANDTLYYMDGGELKSYNFKTEKTETLTNKADIYAVCGGKVFYLDKDNKLYSTDSDDSLASAVVSIGGFIY